MAATAFFSAFRGMALAGPLTTAFGGGLLGFVPLTAETARTALRAGFFAAAFLPPLLVEVAVCVIWISLYSELRSSNMQP